MTYAPDRTFELLTNFSQSETRRQAHFEQQTRTSTFFYRPSGPRIELLTPASGLTGAIFPILPLFGKDEDTHFWEKTGKTVTPALLGCYRKFRSNCRRFAWLTPTPVH